MLKANDKKNVYNDIVHSLVYRAVTHPALRILRKCENLIRICVQVGVCRLQRLMGKPTSPLIEETHFTS
jgi:hypothetical protein